MITMFEKNFSDGMRLKRAYGQYSGERGQACWREKDAGLVWGFTIARFEQAKTLTKRRMLWWSIIRVIFIWNSCSLDTYYDKKYGNCETTFRAVDTVG